MTSESHLKEAQNLVDYYRSLPPKTAPKQDFIRKIAQRCGLEDQTVRLWVWGKTKPQNQEHVQILAEETGIDVDKLFEV